MTTVIVLAMVFVFVALRLWSVLGRRTGHEQTLAKPLERVPAARAGVPVTLPGKDAPVVAGPEQANTPAVTAGLRTIAAADSKFDAAHFVEGAKGAYRMILEAFWRGDEDELRQLVDGEVADAFASAIAERKAAGHTLENRLVTVENAQIEDATVDGATAHIKMRFDADIAAVTRDADGNVIAGSLDDAVPTHDVWTFSRALRSPDPNWTLTETDEAI
ncbi:Tim44/TimA family putative adaptor protein [Sphingomonas sp. BIUV-7]|uniref:Tim44/TimA family putative adaptor protein n=1 Tax=Sphingomonas natans TaxID=3063330 RepID=A0ABT8Y4T5_9SPHN|nr:Tim44/TimA family putative adaptor protein [Sphingomonas sp. BIUV-7]MDO6413007.1 Tim44/TimA family putative adaptor protein [Sphingomonas sp. BIUV-7]